QVLRLRVRTRPPRRRHEPRVSNLEDTVVRPHVQIRRVPDQDLVEIVREPEVDRLEPLAEEVAALVAAHLHQGPDARVLRDLPERVLMPLLERLEPHTRTD